MNLAPLKRKIRSFNRRIREARMIAKALKSPRHPILAHVIPMRRCNLSCTYCNEYDSFSNPVPKAAMCRRLELLAALGTSVVTLSRVNPYSIPILTRLSGASEIMACWRS